jgi:signal transduction histidine kinase
MELIRGRHRPVELLRYAGLFTWFCAVIPIVLVDLLRDTPLPPTQYVEWWILHMLFGVLYWNILRYLPGQASMLRRLAYLLALTGCALGISAVSESPLGGILLLVLAGLLPWVLTSVAAFAWLIAQNILLAAIISRVPDASVMSASISAGLFLGMSLFAFMGSLAAARQQQARDELRKVNSELQATQALLRENTRIAERVRIARELHDLVGHHLTALTLNLEVATHLVDGKALEHVQQAHSLAKLLLADVREVVSDMRHGDKVDLTQALQTLVQGVPQPLIHLDLPSDLVMTDPQRAQLLLRCAQEIITNSVRHAQAQNLWIRLSTGRDGVALSAHDDGRGVNSVQAGNGLRGMRERLGQLGGKLEVESGQGKGFTLHAWLPTEAVS